jgi:glutathione S-transferase
MTPGTTSFVLHEDPVSGNCYKIRLTAALLGVPLERRFYDIRKGETRTQEFLTQVNANGRIPVLEIRAPDNAVRLLPESNAACWYLAEGSPLVPADRFDRADMLHWLFFEQYNHEPNVATLRFWLAYVGEANLTEAQRALIPAKRAGGEAALQLMDAHLATHDWLVGHAVSLADIALYAYTHVSAEGGFDLAQWPHLEAWLARMAALPGYVAIDAN